jgi:hypothetical protein
MGASLLMWFYIKSNILFIHTFRILTPVCVVPAANTHKLPTLAITILSKPMPYQAGSINHFLWNFIGHAILTCFCCSWFIFINWLHRLDLNQRLESYEPSALPDCATVPKLIGAGADMERPVKASLDGLLANPVKLSRQESL